MHMAQEKILEERQTGGIFLPNLTRIEIWNSFMEPFVTPAIPSFNQKPGLKKPSRWSYYIIFLKIFYFLVRYFLPEHFSIRNNEKLAKGKNI